HQAAAPGAPQHLQPQPCLPAAPLQQGSQGKGCSMPNSPRQGAPLAPSASATPSLLLLPSLSHPHPHLHHLLTHAQTGFGSELSSHRGGSSSRGSGTATSHATNPSRPQPWLSGMAPALLQCGLRQLAGGEGGEALGSEQEGSEGPLTCGSASMAGSGSHQADPALPSACAGQEGLGGGGALVADSCAPHPPPADCPPGAAGLGGREGRGQWAVGGPAQQQADLDQQAGGRGRSWVWSAAHCRFEPTSPSTHPQAASPRRQPGVGGAGSSRPAVTPTLLPPPAAAAVDPTHLLVRVAAATVQVASAVVVLGASGAGQLLRWLGEPLGEALEEAGLAGGSRGGGGHPGGAPGAPGRWVHGSPAIASRNLVQSKPPVSNPSRSNCGAGGGAGQGWGGGGGAGGAALPPTQAMQPGTFLDSQLLRLQACLRVLQLVAHELGLWGGRDAVAQPLQARGGLPGPHRGRLLPSPPRMAATAIGGGKATGPLAYLHGVDPNTWFLRMVLEQLAMIAAGVLLLLTLYA
ncbi:hypothetical protein V8C86DRAFT_2781130, partial [Haematococcus lacustris]